MVKIKLPKSLQQEVELNSPRLSPLVVVMSWAYTPVDGSVVATSFGVELITSFVVNIIITVAHCKLVYFQQKSKWK